MRNALRSLALAAALLLPTAATATAPFAGRFTVAAAEGRDPSSIAQVTLAWDDAGSRITSRNVSLTRLGALVADGFQLSNEVPVRFSIQEEAGTLTFSGTARAGRAQGQFTFEPSQPFADQVERRVIDRPTDDQLLALALQGAGLDEIDTFAAGIANRRARARVVELMANGVTLAYVQGLAEVGYRDLTAGQLISLRNHGITPGYVRRLQGLGYAGISPAQVLELDVNGVSAGFVRQANEGRRTPRSVGQLVQMRRDDSR